MRRKQPTATEEIMRLSVRVQPRASRNEIAGMHGTALRIRLTAPPVDGAANDALISYLAGILGVARRSIRIVSGQSSRNKTLEIDGVSLDRPADSVEFSCWPITVTGNGSRSMTSLLLVGTDAALIEGSAQILTPRNYQLFFSRSLADALETVGDVRPLVVLVERSAIDEIRMTL